MADPLDHATGLEFCKSGLFNTIKPAAKMGGKGQRGPAVLGRTSKRGVDEGLETTPDDDSKKGGCMK